MTQQYANEFSEIVPTLVTNDIIREKTLELVQSEPIFGKAVEGGNRANDFRHVLSRVVLGKTTLSLSYRDVEFLLPQYRSIHSGNHRVFAFGWSERLVRTQLSRFYNQAVLTVLTEERIDRCFVPHSSQERPTSPCALTLAGKEHGVYILLHGLLKFFRFNDTTDESPRIPNHSHCTHTIIPIDGIR